MFLIIIAIKKITWIVFSLLLHWLHISTSGFFAHFLATQNFLFTFVLSLRRAVLPYVLSILLPHGTSWANSYCTAKQVETVPNCCCFFSVDKVHKKRRWNKRNCLLDKLTPSLIPMKMSINFYHPVQCTMLWNTFWKS